MLHAVLFAIQTILANHQALGYCLMVGCALWGILLVETINAARPRVAVAYHFQKANIITYTQALQRAPMPYGIDAMLADILA